VSPLREQLELLPGYLSAHVFLTLIALVASALISFPLAFLIVRYRILQGPVLAVASVVQTIPSLALLALMVPLLGQIGRLPAVIALTAYGILPMLRNTVTGILEVDAAVIEAARAVGMRSWQILTKVQLPLASPTIIAGLRTSTVWLVGIATLSTPVGATSLGNYIFSGLQTQQYVAVLVGCVAAAGLAIGLDLLIRACEIAVRRGSARLGVFAGLSLLALFGVGMAPLILNRLPFDSRPRVIVGAKSFTEQYLLARVLAEKLDEAGFATRRRDGLGSMVIFDALRLNEIDCYVDYSGTIWFNTMKRGDVLDSSETLEEMTRWLHEEHRITVLGSLGFQNAYVFAMKREEAQRRGIRTMDDLVDQAPELSLAADYEFFERPDWRQVQSAYDLRFESRLQLDSALMYSAVNEKKVDVIAAFSTDGRIDAFDLVLLEDPKSAFPPYDAVVLLSPAASENETIKRALRPLVDVIDDSTMRQANRMVDVKRQSQTAAANWLLDHGSRTAKVVEELEEAVEDESGG
jgi:osmoprotectant transport system permease protein